MKRIFRSRIFVIISIGVCVCAILTGLFLHQTRFGVVANSTSLWITQIEQEELNEYIEFYSDPAADDFLFFRSNNRFPSNDADDYRKVYVYVDFKNRSIIDYNLYDCYIEFQGSEPQASFALPFSGKNLSANNNNKYISCCMFLMYCPEKNDSDFKDLIQEYSFTIYLQNVIFKDIKYIFDPAKYPIHILADNPYVG